MAKLDCPPYFEFYLTSDFINLGTKSQFRYVLYDNYFNQFEAFTDSGNVSYSLTEDYAEHHPIDAGLLNENTMTLTNSNSR